MYIIYDIYLHAQLKVNHDHQTCGYHLHTDFQAEEK